MALHSDSSPSVLERILAVRVPLWLVAAIVIFFALATVSFGWLVMRSANDERPLAKAALAVASFPTETKAVFKEIARILSGKPDHGPVMAYPPEQSWSEFQPVKSRLEGVGEGLLMRRGPATPARGWRVIAGAMQIHGSLQTAAVLLSPELEIVHYWPLIEDAEIGAHYSRPLRKMPHGLAVLSDGSVIYNFDGGASLHRKDICGRTLWAVPGDYHHSITSDDTETTVWTHRDDETGDRAQKMHLMQVATADGRIVKDISVPDIIAANPDIDILELRRLHTPDKTGNTRERPGRWMSDPIHLNDIDPLPRSLADRYPMFSPGDLLISARELNLLFVMDPESLAIKWWKVGATIRQHDSDWNTDGRLSAFNNRMSRGYSTITKIDPATLARSVAVDGRGMDLYSRHRGSHQPLPNGGWLISSTQQGRILEVSPDGKVALDFYSRLTGDTPLYSMLSTSVFLPEDAVDPGALKCGVNSQ
ncbi:arylsulfotransferase family protein [Dongia deserti]|uniref:arylsulfotransferase family protein n=1 Tax=Dongia deserti TaxID=2268030 RepID=UPI000E65547D|nr:arylsulfotransferase family protein [Dongia deserti]